MTPDLPAHRPIPPWGPPTVASSTHRRPYTKFEILPNLYLSEFPEEIPNEITHVLNMCTRPHPPPDTSRTILHIPLKDVDDITPHIPSILSFIDNAFSSNGIVLVHCAVGINRSAAAIVAYLCHRNDVDADEALLLVKEKKRDAWPFACFLDQIDEFFGREVEEKEVPLVGFHRRLQGREKRLGEEERE